MRGFLSVGLFSFCFRWQKNSLVRFARSASFHIMGHRPHNLTMRQGSRPCTRKKGHGRKLPRGLRPPLLGEEAGRRGFCPQGKVIALSAVSDTPQQDRMGGPSAGRKSCAWLFQKLLTKNYCHHDGDFLRCRADVPPLAARGAAPSSARSGLSGAWRLCAGGHNGQWRLPALHCRRQCLSAPFRIMLKRTNILLLKGAIWSMLKSIVGRSTMRENL